MATTNRVYCWKDGDRLFVDLNGATIEAKSLTFDQHVVTLQFQGKITEMKTVGASPDRWPMAAAARSANECDPLFDECLW